MEKSRGRALVPMGERMRARLLVVLAGMAAAAVLVVRAAAPTAQGLPAPGAGAQAGVAADAGAGSDGGPAGDAQVAPGQHWRLSTSSGPVHVWIPAGYDPGAAGTVLYVHGYYVDVDRAYEQYRLAAQFHTSGRNALFIVPEAPSRSREPVVWTDLGALLRTVRQETGLERPWGPVVAMGHSGAYRTLVTWLAYRPLEQVILLDALYGQERQFDAWLDEAKAEPNRLMMISMDTLRWAEPWARERGFAYAMDWQPSDIRDVPPQALAARVLHIRGQYGHMELVTESKTIPLLLQATRLRGVGGDEGR